MALSLRQLRYFIAVVEAGGYSQAAERLYVAQSALSRQIKELEESIGTLLFRREGRGVTLTEAGEAFYRGAGQTLARLQESVGEARAAGEGDTRTLRLLHSSSVPLADPWLARLRGFVTGHPQVGVHVETANSEHQLDEIEEERADLGLLRLPVLRGRTGVVIRPLHLERLVVALPAGHTLASRDALAIGELRDEGFVAVPHRERGGLSRRVAELCQQAGFFPRPAGVTSRKLAQLSLVAGGLGIAVVPESLRSLSPPGVVFARLECQDAGTTIALAHRRSPAPLVSGLVAALLAGDG